MKKLKILICENDEDELAFAKEGFEQSGYFEVTKTVGLGVELLEYISASKIELLPDIILTDLNMPGVNGLDIAEAVKNNPLLHRISVYISSTVINQPTAEKCYAMGAKGFLKKPYKFNEYQLFAQNLYELECAGAAN